MKWPSFSVIVSAVFSAYLAHTVWTLYSLFNPKLCAEGEHCVNSNLRHNPELDIVLAVSTKSSVRNDRDLTQVHFKSHFNVSIEDEVTVNVSIPETTRNNGSLYVHIFLLPTGKKAFHSRGVYAYSKITTYAVPAAQTINLIADEQEASQKVDSTKLVTHWRSKITLSVMTDNASFGIRSIPAELYRLMKITPEREYLPILYIDELNYRIKDLVPVNISSVSLPLTIIYKPISVGKLRMWTNFQESVKMLHSLGFTEKDTDEVKGIFADTNFYFLMLTFLVAAFHLLFDFLAFKNDISYWRERKDMVGLSTKVILWRCISTFIIFLYLFDENTSLLVLIPAGIGTLIEVWKVTKAFKVKLNWSKLLPKIEFGLVSEKEKETQGFDSEAMRYLAYIMWPLCFGGAVYSLYYVPHKSWYSWCIHSLVNCIYAFGFLFMLPQLFLNYKLKSVAHLPWRAFMYKAFNTFIDDIFAFIITMPTAHRVACFRDDLVFVIFLYQKWLYPVDKTRANEYGQTFDKDSEDKKSK